MRILKTTACILVAMGTATSGMFAQGTAFSYQGRLNQNAGAATGIYDLRFLVYASPVAPSPLGGPVVISAVPITNGLFSATLDFGAGIFTGPSRWLEISVRTNGAASFTPLEPRQQMTPVPYATHAATASNVVNGLVVRSLNSLRDDVTLVGGAGVTLTPAGNSITIAATNVGGTSGPWALNGVSAFYNGGNVGIGTATPSARLFVVSPTAAAADNTATFYAPAIGQDASHIHYGTMGDWFIRSANSGGKVVLQDFGGNVGIGTPNPAAKLDVRGHLVMDPGVSPTLYTAAGGGEQNRYLQLINSPSSPSASGLKAGGLLVADSYGFAEPGKNDLIVKGSVGIGTASLVSALEIDRQDALRIRGFQPFLTMSDSAGFGLIRKANRFMQVVDGDLAFLYRPECNVFPCNQATESHLTIRFNGLVGIGTSLPQTKLHLYHGPDSVSHRIETGGGVNAWSRTEYANANGMWITGTSRGFNGDQFYIYRVGSPGITFGLQPNGDAYLQGTMNCRVLTITGGADLAEPFKMSEDEIPKGSVVVIDEENPGQLKLSTEAYDTRVAGIVSGANGVKPGISLHQEGALEGGENVALSGRVYVHADATNGAIKPGDLLTTSDTPGHAMKVGDHARAQGAILGKAMTGLKVGKGMVLVLVTLQ